VIYGAITHADPRRSRWHPHRMSRRIARELRDVAFHALDRPSS